MKCYCLAAMLEGHDGPINTFSINTNGTLLASGGDDQEVRLWDIQAFRRYQILSDRGGTWGQITCIKFLGIEPSAAAEWFCFGTGHGYLLLYRRQRKTVSALFLSGFVQLKMLSDKFC
jgi:WD40 repeat protein